MCQECIYPWVDAAFIATVLIKIIFQALEQETYFVAVSLRMRHETLTSRSYTFWVIHW